MAEAQKVASPVLNVKERLNEEGEKNDSFACIRTGKSLFTEIHNLTLRPHGKDATANGKPVLTARQSLLQASGYVCIFLSLLILTLLKHVRGNQ